MDILSSLAIVALAALIHASFQLSVSVLTLLSGHAIGAKRSHARLLRLTTGFVLGAAVMTTLLVSFLAFLFLHLFSEGIPQLVWAATCGLLLGVGVAVWLFYYRRERGTTLWIPRGLASFLSDRSKGTKRSAEAFSLGLTSILGEILFILAPLTISALVLVSLPSAWQLLGIALYALISMSSLLIVWGAVGSGHKLSAIQRWREDNKHFLQFAAGSALLVLAFFVYVTEVLGVAVGGGS